MGYSWVAISSIRPSVRWNVMPRNISVARNIYCTDLISSPLTYNPSKGVLKEFIKSSPCLLDAALFYKGLSRNKRIQRYYDSCMILIDATYLGYIESMKFNYNCNAYEIKKFVPVYVNRCHFTDDVVIDKIYEPEVMLATAIEYSDVPFVLPICVLPFTDFRVDIKLKDDCLKKYNTTYIGTLNKNNQSELIRFIHGSMEIIQMGIHHSRQFRDYLSSPHISIVTDNMMTVFTSGMMYVGPPIQQYMKSPINPEEWYKRCIDDMCFLCHDFKPKTLYDKMTNAVTDEQKRKKLIEMLEELKEGKRSFFSAIDIVSDASIVINGIADDEFELRF